MSTFLQAAPQHCVTGTVCLPTSEAQVLVCTNLELGAIHNKGLCIIAACKVESLCPAQQPDLGAETASAELCPCPSVMSWLRLALNEALSHKAALSSQAAGTKL